ncbi:hypothetical protein FHR83_000833 [Actinoplanes campanulatus]|uniref:Uncharacterized protein n=1 Tax=Actinoplanes campanulatus TaxID=113559 RepID=A0A7W5AC26_9ACTN|nr:hypothetical protein [Actinoplanes campanulatus]
MAAHIDADTPTEITRQGRELSYQAALAQPASETGAAMKPALVPGHGVPDQSPQDFDPDAIVRSLRES